MAIRQTLTIRSSRLDRIGDRIYILSIRETRRSVHAKPGYRAAALVQSVASTPASRRRHRQRIDGQLLERARLMAGSWWLSLGAEQRAVSSRHERLMRVKEGDLKRKSVGAMKDHQIDWTAFDAITDEDIARQIRDDADVAPELDDGWFATATLVMPRAKEQISIRLDRDVLEHFRRYPRYQTRINAILRAAMEHEKKSKAG